MRAVAARRAPAAWRKSSEPAIELLRYLQVVRRRWLLVVLTIAATLLAAWSLTPRDNRYTAESILFVGAPPTNLDPAGSAVSSDRQVGISYVASTFVEMIQTRTVIEQGIDEAGVERDAGHVLAAVDATTRGIQLITVSVTDGDPETAQALANGVSQAFIDILAVQERAQQEVTGAYDDGFTPVSVLERAGLPTEPLPDGLVRNVLLGLLFGSLLAVAVVLLLEYLDLTVRTPEDAERRIGLPVLGVIPVSADVLPGTARSGVRTTEAVDA